MKIPTYEQLLMRVLDRIPNSVDKREGSLIQTAVGPVCAELAQAYAALDAALDLAFADTACGTYLDRLAEQAGIFRGKAECAVCRAEFRDTAGAYMEIPHGMRFGMQEVFFRCENMLEPGIYEVRCETAGMIGNIQHADLLPADFLDRLGSAEITALLSPGIEEETDEELRKRLLRHVTEPAFGGNIADYRAKVGEIAGVGAVKVEPVPQGGGTVALHLLGVDFLPADEKLLQAVQTAADPEPGKGKGFAPIGHTVTVKPAIHKNISASAELTLTEQANAENVKKAAEYALQNYFLELRKKWAEENFLTVRLSRMLAAVLAVDGVLDAKILIDGAEKNLELSVYEVPVLQNLTLQIPQKGALG